MNPPSPENLISLTCCTVLVFDDESHDVFGTPINLGLEVGTAVSTAVQLTDFDGNLGKFAATAAASTPAVLSFGITGDFSCTNYVCMPQSNLDALTGKISVVTTTTELPTDLAYTYDGAGPVGIPVLDPIPGCPITTPVSFFGSFAISAFEPVLTQDGVPVLSSATYFDPVAGKPRTLSVRVTYAQVNVEGLTTIAATSSAAGEIPSNFAVHVDGHCEVDVGQACCSDDECADSQECIGCFHSTFADVSTTADVTAPIEICIDYDDDDNDGVVDDTSIDETTLYVLHKASEEDPFVDETSSRDFDNNVICAEVDQLSPFVVATGPPVPPEGDCPATVDGACTDGFEKGLLLIKENVPGKEKLIVKLLKGPALAQVDLGDPVAEEGTAYALCIYDVGGDLAGSAVVDRAGDDCGGRPCWKALGGDPPGGKGYKYKDNDLGADGIQKIIYKGGGAGKSKVVLKGKGPNLPNAIPAALESSANATVQLRASNAQCLTVTVDDVKKREADYFKAKFKAP